MNERNIVPTPFTAQEIEYIKLQSDFRTRCLIEALEDIARAAASHISAENGVTKSRVEVMRGLRMIGID